MFCNHSLSINISFESLWRFIYTMTFKLLWNQGVRKTKTEEMKLVTGTAGYSLLDRRRNEDILLKLEVDKV
jgi:hypothetical protein